MRVCQVTSLHDRYDSRIYQKYAKSAVINGNESYLICCDELPSEVKDNVNIISSGISFKSSRVKRFLFSKKVLLKKCLSINADIYHLHDPDLIKLGATLLRKKKHVVFDSHEDYFVYIQSKTWIPKPFRKIIQWYYNCLQRRLLKRFSGVIAPDDALTSKMKVINPNSITVSNYPRLFDVKRKKTSGKLTLCFGGAIIDKYNHDRIIEAINSFKGEVVYNLAGRKNAYLDTVLTLDGAKYVDYLGFLNFDSMLEMYAHSDIGMVIYDYDANVNYKVGSMGVLKIFEYMMAGMPFICTDFELWKDIVDNNEFGHPGIYVRPDNSEDIINAISFYMKHPEIIKEYGANGRKLAVKKYNWNIYDSIVNDFYNSIIIE